MERALPILIQACGALDEAHKAGIIHRDLKPENIFLVQRRALRDFPKVLDFGLAKVGERQMRPGSVILTQEGMVFGTPEFMSPEQAQGKTLTPASDIYSLAVILYEVLTGKLPFDAKSAMDYIQLHVTGKPIPLSQRVPGRRFPPLLEQIMDRALAKQRRGPLRQRGRLRGGDAGGASGGHERSRPKLSRAAPGRPLRRGTRICRKRRGELRSSQCARPASVRAPAPARRRPTGRPASRPKPAPRAASRRAARKANVPLLVGDRRRLPARRRGPRGRAR